MFVLPFTDDPGTLVTQEDSTMEALLVSGIAFDKDQARVTLHDLPDQPDLYRNPSGKKTASRSKLLPPGSPCKQ